MSQANNRKLVETLLQLISQGSGQGVSESAGIVSLYNTEAPRSGPLTSWATSVSDTIDVASALSGFQLRVRLLALTVVSGASDCVYRLWSASSPLATYRFGANTPVGFAFNNWYFQVPSLAGLRLSRDQGEGLIAATIGYTTHPNTDPN